MIDNLNALRGLAAWMVVIHHMRTPLSTIWPPIGETMVLASGVDLFFVLSGVVMVVSADRRNMTPRVFMLRRIARVAPLYWLATLAVTALLICGFAPAGVSEWNGGDLLASLAFWPDIRADEYPGPLLPVGWTLTYEAGFYALFAIALFAGRAAGLVVFALLIALALVGAALPDGAPYFAHVWTAPLMLEFAMGVALGIWWTASGSGAGGARRRDLAIAAGAAALAFAAVFASPPLGPDLISPGSKGASLRVVYFGGPATLLIWAALIAERSGAVLSSAWVQRQGAISYAIYLMHLPVLHLAEKTAGFPGVIAAPVLIAIIAGALYDRIERPATHALRNVFETGVQQRPKSSSSRMMSSSSR